MLSRAVRRRNLHDHDSAPDAVLLLQSDRALRADILDGAARVYAAAWLRGEAHTWLVPFRDSKSHINTRLAVRQPNPTLFGWVVYKMSYKSM